MLNFESTPLLFSPLNEMFAYYFNYLEAKLNRSLKRHPGYLAYSTLNEYA